MFLSETGRRIVAPRSCTLGGGPLDRTPRGREQAVPLGCPAPEVTESGRGIWARKGHFWWFDCREIEVLRTELECRVHERREIYGFGLSVFNGDNFEY
jgi:hypothetical protein